jgi:hypothetical protein
MTVVQLLEDDIEIHPLERKKNEKKTKITQSGYFLRFLRNK